MSKHDDLLDGYIGYTIFEDSMKGGGGRRPQKSGWGFFKWFVIISFIWTIISMIASCEASKKNEYYDTYLRKQRTPYYSSYSTSSSNSSSSSSGSSSSRSTGTYSGNSSSKTKTKNSSSDPYDAKSYYHPDDFYYDHYDDFWDYEDAEDYWEEHN